ncbi:MAG: hypothetical protein ABI878_02385 [Acidobacteriota bacterium]
MQNNDPNTAAQQQTMIVVWGALLFSQLLFLALIFFIKRELFDLRAMGPILGNNSLIVIAFGTAALAAVAASFVLRKQNVKKAIEMQNVGLVQTGLIIGCAFCEVSSLLGVMLAFAFNYHYFFLWIGVGVLAMLFHFPRRSDIEAANFKTL